MAQKLTKRVVDGLKAEGVTGDGRPKRAVVFDTEVRGFGVRVTPAGAKSFFVDYRAGHGRNAAKKRHIIGGYGTPWTVDTARAEAKRLLHVVEAGGDPAAQRAAERRGPEAGTTFEAVARGYLDLEARRLRSSTMKDYRAVLERRLVPHWGKRDVASIQRRDVTALVVEIESTAPVMARLAFAVVRSFFGWCIEKGYRDDNPCDGLKGPPAPKSRDRVLDDDEVAHVWRASLALGFPFGPAVRLLILTAARRDEVGGLAWSELDLDAALWRLPAARAKNDSGHDLDLHDLAVAELEPIVHAGPLVFTTTTKPLQGWSKAKLRLDDAITRQRRDEAKPHRVGETLTAADRPAHALAPWRIHDLRRTAATGMAATGFAPQVVERVLNHKSGIRGGLVGVYQRHEYRDERRAASLAWGQRVARIVGATNDPSKVVPFAGDGSR